MYMQNKFNSIAQILRKHATLLTLLTLAVVLFTIPLTVVILQSEQDIRQIAAQKKKEDKKEKKRERAKRKKHAAVPGRILIRFNPQPETSIQATSSTEDRLRKKYGATIERKDNLKLRVITVKPGTEQAVIDDLIEDPGIDFVEQSSYGYINAEPNDTDFNKQWGLKKIGAPAAWDTSEGDGIVIAILDTGIDENHPDLKGKILNDKSVSMVSGGGKGNTQDQNGHGTHVAGIAAAMTDNKKGIAGVCPKCKIMNVKIMPDSGVKGLETDFAEGIRYAIDNGANIINMSIQSPDDMETVNEAIDYANQKGVLVVAAAGNCGGGTNDTACPTVNAPGYPAAYNGTLAVAATDENDKRASFSNYGKYIDIAAPGDNILSTFPTYAFELQKSRPELKTNYGAVGGTSMASPMVAGLAGLLMSQGMSATEARAAIVGSADEISGTGKLWQNGRINASQAIKTEPAKDEEDDSPTPNPCITPEENSDENDGDTNEKNDETTDNSKAERTAKESKKAPIAKPTKEVKEKNNKESGTTLGERLENLRDRVFGGNASGNVTKGKGEKAAKKEARKQKKEEKKSGKTKVQAKDPCEPNDTSDKPPKSEKTPKPSKASADDKAARRAARGKAPRPTRAKNKAPKQSSGKEGSEKVITNPGSGGVTKTVERTCEPATVKTPGGVTTIPCDETKAQSVTLLEYNAIIDCYGDAQEPKACSSEKLTQADINKDGKVNQLDYNLFLSQIKQK